ncbi:MAG: doubled CXXCH motif-containing protein [Planctomycetota bacterium]|nr:MAG: doubled CXXCH motif-containing protein [Planctomycetota bacterium]
MLRSSRELSSRVDLRVHQQPNRLRRAAWWLALWAAVGSLLWLTLQHSLGEHQIYQAGDVTIPHRLIENECWRCHTTWTPLQRLTSFSDDLHSIDNKKCESCHRVAEHHANQVPAHRDISCAACHQEHEGAAMLTQPSNRHCIACHADLKTTHGPSEIFAKNVTRFDQLDGHPDFLLKTLVTAAADAPPPHAKHGANRAIEHFQRPGDAAPRWQDRGRIRFNHAMHLKAEYDSSGKLIHGLIGKDRKFTDLSRSCEVCHEPDHEGRFLKPISFERHCRECHPLLFDHERFPGQSVPHQTPDIVRGFLTETYTLKEVGSRKLEVGTQSDSQLRPLPGHRDFQRLSKEQAKAVLDDVTKAETIAQQHRHSQFGYEATGGCRYCHEVEPVATKSPTSLADWRIVPTNIPSRWLAHSEFHHEPHRLLSCSACHAGVAQSKNTGDVLIPSIDICRTCHAQRPGDWLEPLRSQKSDAVSSNSPHQPQSELLIDLLSSVNRGARTSCIECHKYHDPIKDRRDGSFVR